MYASKIELHTIFGYKRAFFEKSSLMNWIFNLQKSISKLIFAGYTGSTSSVRNRLKITLTIRQMDGVPQSGADWCDTAESRV